MKGTSVNCVWTNGNLFLFSIWGGLSSAFPFDMYSDIKHQGLFLHHLRTQISDSDFVFMAHKFSVLVQSQTALLGENLH